MKLLLSEDYAINTDDYRKEGLRIGILASSGAQGLLLVCTSIKSQAFESFYGSV